MESVVSNKLEVGQVRESEGGNWWRILSVPAPPTKMVYSLKIKTGIRPAMYDEILWYSDQVFSMPIVCPAAVQAHERGWKAGDRFCHSRGTAELRSIEAAGVTFYCSDGATTTAQELSWDLKKLVIENSKPDASAIGEWRNYRGNSWQLLYAAHGAALAVDDNEATMTIAHGRWLQLPLTQAGPGR